MISFHERIHRKMRAYGSETDSLMIKQFDPLGLAYNISLSHHIVRLVYDVLQGLWSPQEYLKRMQIRYAVDLVDIAKDSPRICSYLLWTSLTPKLVYLYYFLYKFYSTKPRPPVRNEKVKPYNVICLRVSELLPIMTELWDSENYSLNWKSINLYVTTGVYKNVLSPLVMELSFLFMMEIYNYYSKTRV